jgi:hypothetical protein
MATTEHPVSAPTRGHTPSGQENHRRSVRGPRRPWSERDRRLCAAADHIGSSADRPSGTLSSAVRPERYGRPPSTPAPVAKRWIWHSRQQPHWAVWLDQHRPRCPATPVDGRVHPDSCVPMGRVVGTGGSSCFTRSSMCCCEARQGNSAEAGVGTRILPKSIPTMLPTVAMAYDA